MLIQLFFLLLVFTKENYSFSYSSNNFNSNQYQVSANSNPYQMSATFNSNPYQMSSVFNSNPQIHSFKQSFSQEKNPYLSTITSYAHVSSTHEYSLSSTMAPTFKPTQKHRQRYTRIPTQTPTTMPSFLEFDTIIKLSGFPQKKMNEQDKIIYIDAFSTSTNISSTYIKIINQHRGNRHLSYNIDVTTKITYPYESNPELIYDSLTDKIKSSVEKGNFTYFLKNAPATAFNNIIISGFLISPIVLLTMEPTAAPIPYYENSKSFYSIIYISIITISIFSIIILLLLRFKWLYDNKGFRCQSSKNNRTYNII